jgi:hypothetical protein
METVVTTGARGSRTITTLGPFFSVARSAALAAQTIDATVSINAKLKKRLLTLDATSIIGPRARSRAKAIE